MSADLSWLPLELPPSYQRDSHVTLFQRGTRIRLDYTDPGGTARALVIALDGGPGLFHAMGLTFSFPGDLTAGGATRARVAMAVGGHIAKRVGHRLRAALETAERDFIENESPSSEVLPAGGNEARQGPTTLVYVSEAELSGIPQNEWLANAIDRVTGADGAVELRLWLATVCDQSCAFCVFPSLRSAGQAPRPQASFVESLTQLLDGICCVATHLEVLLEGPDCLQHPHILEILDTLALRPALDVGFRGPMTGTTKPEIIERIGSMPNRIHVELTVLSTHAGVHDELVGRQGAHRKTLDAIAALKRIDTPVTVSIVVLPQNVAEIPALIRRWAPEHRVWLTLYHPEGARSDSDEWRRLDLTELLVSGSAMRSALSQLSAADLEPVAASHIPICWVPHGLRSALLLSAGDVGPDFVHPSECAGCSLRPDCPGVTIAAALFPDRLDLIPEE